LSLIRDQLAPERVEKLNRGAHERHGDSDFVDDRPKQKTTISRPKKNRRWKGHGFRTKGEVISEVLSITSSPTIYFFTPVIFVPFVVHFLYGLRD